MKVFCTRKPRFSSMLGVSGSSGSGLQVAGGPPPRSGEPLSSGWKMSSTRNSDRQQRSDGGPASASMVEHASCFPPTLTTPCADGVRAGFDNKWAAARSAPSGITPPCRKAAVNLPLSWLNLEAVCSCCDLRKAESAAATTGWVKNEVGRCCGGRLSAEPSNLGSAGGGVNGACAKYGDNGCGVGGKIGKAVPSCSGDTSGCKDASSSAAARPGGADAAAVSAGIAATAAVAAETSPVLSARPSP
mmetsp:Transcript_43885/g.111701  ORF Transcript_43885/g.111701 Transcript_43885/m.111701 type:complete len:245 (+) Transcript_43885:336-1070(+)